MTDKLCGPVTQKRTFEYSQYRKKKVLHLGIYLDEHLQWEPQIQHVNNKLAENAGIINKLRHLILIFISSNSYIIPLFIHTT